MTSISHSTAGLGSSSLQNKSKEVGVVRSLLQTTANEMLLRRRNSHSTLDSDLDSSSLLLRERRPIITGCLEECGPEDQACVTDCQVCVEQHVCISLHDDDCSSCMSEAHKARALAKSKRLLVDSGGISLVHEGLRQKVVKSKMRVLEGHRALRRARRKVLDVQRLSEWAAAELDAEVKKLNESRGELDGYDVKANRWLTESKVEIEALHAEVDKTKKVLRGQRKALQQVDERLAEIRSKGWMAAGEVVTATRAYRRLRYTMRTQRRELKAQKAKLRQARESRIMMRRSLREERRSLIKAVTEHSESTRQMREHCQLYQDDLRKAKRGYRHAAAVSQAQERVQQMLEQELASTPLPDFRPKDAIPEAPTEPSLDSDTI
eukprot:CAMPEP_0206484914 /NCGR_PEP_ID=MMETSP0324_2-20121206/40235_1 /ASSEMBLY_ACC=CAM_ASM_000836 /TAXON_ID=2866 /ORGANISM="Crypthecodinium cohnii, Strain Seligo" /LENGTH=377 /DNA_ID=CAMNT_0053963107 /DNA_START=446 /DNA_END=1579 /DNA_ORIENTATION=+